MSEQETTERGQETIESYERLVEKQKQCAYLDDARDLLNWDKQTVMPEGGMPARSKQIGVLSELLQERQTDPEIGDLLDTIDTDELDDGQRAVVREIRREYDRLVSVPPDLSERISEVTAEATEVWEEAKAADDFGRFVEPLQRVLEVKREEAAAIDSNRDPYAVLFSDHAPYIDIETVEQIFDDLRAVLVPLVGDIRASDVSLSRGALEGTFDEEGILEASDELLDALGFDRERGLTDTVPNALATGNQFDCRIGLWTYPEDLFISLLAPIHEFGHALYNQHLPQEHYGTPRGSDRGTTVQESQSMFWQDMIARTPEFWAFAHPILMDHLSLDTSPRDLYESFTAVRPTEQNALKADELSLHLHTLVRFEIERALIEGDLTPADVPEVWRDTYEKYLGFRPESDAQGPLLTIHWAAGGFAYFPTYTLGPVMAAQFAATARDEIEDLDGHVRRGDFEPIRTWLRDEIHQHGQRYTTPELLRRVTGDDLTADYYIDHVTEKFTDLYEL